MPFSIVPAPSGRWLAAVPEAGVGGWWRSAGSGRRAGGVASGGRPGRVAAGAADRGLALWQVVAVVGSR